MTSWKRFHCWDEVSPLMEQCILSCFQSRARSTRTHRVPRVLHGTRVQSVIPSSSVMPTPWKQKKFIKVESRTGLVAKFWSSPRFCFSYNYCRCSSSMVDRQGAVPNGSRPGLAVSRSGQAVPAPPLFLKPPT